MTFAWEGCLPADVTLCPTDGEVGRGTDATTIRAPKARPGILGRDTDRRNQRQEREQGKNQGGSSIAVAVQHRTSETQNSLNSSSEETVLLGLALSMSCEGLLTYYPLSQPNLCGVDGPRMTSMKLFVRFYQKSCIILHSPVLNTQRDWLVSGRACRVRKEPGLGETGFGWQ